MTETGSCSSVKPTDDGRKTWSFRRSTIARRAVLMDPDIQETNAAPARRSGRRIKRTDKLLQFLSTAKRGRGARRQAPLCLEHCQSSTQIVTADAKSTSEPNSLEGHKAKGPGETSTIRMTAERVTDQSRRARCVSGSYSNSTDTEDSDELTLKELQDLLKKRKKGETKEAAGPGSLVVAYELESKRPEDCVGEPDSVQHAGGRVPRGVTAEAMLTEEGPQSKMGGKPSRWRKRSEEQEEYMEEEESSQSDPDALYCICRQKHNERFMICCDRCEEWFHGDCVGITEAEGRQLEENGEDYICPSCTTQTILPDDTSVPSANAYGGIGATINQPTTEITGLPKCIGPGCRKNALPDSVYCSSDCIVRHAAEAMKNLTNMKEPRLRLKPDLKVQTKLAQGNTAKDHKRSVQRRRMSHGETFSKAEERHDLYSDEEWVEVEQNTPNCFTEHHEYTVKLNKTSASLSEREHAEEEFKKVPVCTQNPFITGSQSAEGSRKLTAQDDGVTRGHWQSPGNSTGASQKCAPPPAMNWESLAAAPGDTPTSQLSASLPSHCPVSRVLSFSRATYMIPKKHLHLPFCSQQLTNTPIPSSSLSSNVTRPPPVSLGFPVLSRPPQTNAMRQNICRSFTEILCKRVSDSDDLQIPESEMEKLALSIEKEMFSIFLDTDRHYRNKYNSLMFSLKDPKNKSLFYRVVKGEVSPFLLVRLSSEQLLSVERSGHEPGEEHKECLSVPADSQSVVGTTLDTHCSMVKTSSAECMNNPSDCNSKIRADQMPDEEEPNISKFSVSSVAQQLDVTVEQDSWPSGERTSDIQPARNKPVIAPKDIQTTITSSSLIMSSTAISHPGPSSATSQELSPVGNSAPSTICTATESVTEIKPVQSLNTHSPLSLSRFSQLNLASSPHFTFDSSISMADTVTPQKSDTAQFLSEQQVLWKGSVNMHTVTRFSAKAYLVSGSSEYLEKNLPCSIQISGRISPSTVWDYVGRLKASLSKDLCLIRFRASVGEEERAYVSLFSYLSSRGRFGVVANNSSHIKDLYIITLNAKAPIPSKLLPFEGPGLESSHPDLLLGLVICQKPKCFAVPSESNDKITNVKIIASEEAALPAQQPVPRSGMRHGNAELLDTNVSYTSSDSSVCIHPPVSLQSSFMTSPAVAQPSSVRSPSDSSLVTISPSSTSDVSPFSAPRNALFLKQKLDDSASYHGSAVEIIKPKVCDPVEQIFDQICKGEEDDDDENDPEKEYNTGMDMNEIRSNRDSVNEFAVNQSTDASAVNVDDGAYDPENGSIFEELQSLTRDTTAQVMNSPDSSRSDCSVLMEKKKMLEKLNKEIELQKQQLEEQEETLRQQRAAIGLSMAHFSVSDALMSPPSKSLQSKSRLVGLGENTVGLLSKHSAALTIGSIGSSKKSDILHETTNTSQISQFLPKERTCAQANVSCAYRSEITIQPSSQEVSFLDTENTEMCNPLFHKKEDPQMEKAPPQKHVIKAVKDGKNYSEDEMQSNSYVFWENSTHILNTLSPKSQTTSTFMPDTQSSQLPGVTNCLGDNHNPDIPTVGLEKHDFGSTWEMPNPITLQSQMEQHKVQDESDQSGPSYIYPPFQNDLRDTQQQSCSSQKIVNRSIMGLRDYTKCEHTDQRSPSQKMRQMDRHSREATECQEPSPIFDGQRHSYQSRFKKPRSIVNYSRPNVPVQSVRTHQNNSGSRDPHFPDLRVFSSSNLMSHEPRKPLLDTPKDIELQYPNHKNHFLNEMENQNVYESLCMSREAHIYSQELYSGSAHNMSDWANGPVHRPFPQSQEMPSSQHRGFFRDYRGFPPSTLQVKVSPSSSQCSGPLNQPTNHFSGSTEQKQLHFQHQHIPLEARPTRRSGPLLPTPPEYLIQIPKHNGQSSGFYHQGYCNRYPDVGRKSTFSNNSELGNNGIRLRRVSRFQSGCHEKESFKYSEDWRRGQGGFDLNAWTTDLEVDKPGGPERYQKRDSRGRTKDDDMKRENYLKRQEKGDRDRDRNRECDRDCEKDRNSAHNQSRSRDRDRGKHLGHDRTRGHRQDMKRDKYLEVDTDAMLLKKRKRKDLKYES
ncbi:death-inducer obliterator 1-like isoform X2 [Brienomyrus brachyistius]|uniref:death-inducer obliterator 1-like isoform X2 n=1 Tax=Brienomyrus brachyistius TaxID=42636 RepID=UPI0020B2216B|nr:death-inducer obliterator 1-like isoform X2 [Brienomyrus brachyistius]